MAKGFLNKGGRLLVALALLLSTISGLPLGRATAATNCYDNYWPHTGALEITKYNANNYNIFMRFTLTDDEVCALQHRHEYLEIENSLYGFGNFTDQYSIATNLPGGIKDTAAGDPTDQPTPAVTGIITSRLVAGREYYVSMSLNNVYLQADAEQKVIVRWVPSYWARLTSPSERGYCATGKVLGDDAWCIFGDSSQSAPLFGQTSFTNGLPNGSWPMVDTYFTWKPDANNHPVITVQPLSVATPIPTNTPPVAAFSYTRKTGAGNQVLLDGGGSYDPNGSIASWTWYRDGTQIATGKTPTVSLGAPTSTNITLNVIDNNGASASVTKTVTAYNRTPVLTGSTPANGATIGDVTPTLSVSGKDDDADPLVYNFRIYGPSVDLSSGWTSNTSWTVPASRLDPGQQYTWTVQGRDPSAAYTSARSSTLQIAMLPTASEMVSTSTGKGYWQVATDGGVFAYGDAQFYGSLPGTVQVDNIIGMARTSTDKGYWLVGRDGGVFAFGDAVFANSLPGLGVHVSNIVGMAPTKDGKGYWLAGSDGGVFAFGTAQFYGSMGGRPLNKPVEAIAPTPSSQGYWLVAQDGGVFAFGDAPFLGSMGGQPLNYPVIDMDTTPDGQGYWLTAEDGGVFAFGNAQFYGSMAGRPLNGRITGMSSTPDAKGYWLNGCDGGIFAFGSAPFYGSQPRYGCRGIFYN
jgi:hypothetical protein